MQFIRSRKSSSLKVLFRVAGHVCRGRALRRDPHGPRPGPLGVLDAHEEAITHRGYLECGIRAKKKCQSDGGFGVELDSGYPSESGMAALRPEVSSIRWELEA